MRAILTIKNYFFTSEFGGFLLAGGFAALVNFGSRIVFSRFTSFEIAIVLAYLVGMAVAYLLNKYFVFAKSVHSTAKEIYFFVLINILALVQTWAVSVFLYKYALVWAGVDTFRAEVSHLAGIVTPAFTSYIGHKLLTFKKH